MARPSYTGPAHPIGYIEVQRGWVGEKTPDELREMIDELIAKTLSENPGYKQDDRLGRGARVEFVPDGAGVVHYTMYMGFVPIHVAAEPLNPHNLNDAPTPQPGMIEPEDGITPLGYREAAFGRGTD